MAQDVSLTPKEQRPRRRISALFAALMILLPLQAYGAIAYMEPYPALLLPGFRGTRMDYDRSVYRVRAEFRFYFTDGRVEARMPRQVLPAMPEAMVPVIMDYQFRSRRLPPASALAPFPGWQVRLLPGYVLARRRQLSWDGVQPDNARWLQRRAAELFTGRTLTRAEVVWQQERYRVDKVRTRIGSYELERVEIPLS